MRIEVILALLYPVAVGLALFGILRWAKRERARLMRQRPGARLINGSAEIVRGHLTDGLKLYLLGRTSNFYSILTRVLIVIVLLAVAAVLVLLLYLFFKHRP